MSDGNGRDFYVRVDRSYVARQAREALSLFFAPFHVWSGRASTARPAARYADARRRLIDYHPGRPDGR